jgi:hypothetical protein
MAADPQDSEIVHLPLAGTRSQMMQRLQFGLGGLGAMILLVGVANVIVERVKQTDASVVPEAAASVAANQTPVASDPLADAGVAPDVAATPSPKPTRPIMIDPDAIPAPPRQ